MIMIVALFGLNVNNFIASLSVFSIPQLFCWRREPPRNFRSLPLDLLWIRDGQPVLTNPETESVEICHSLTQRNLIGSGGFLEGEDLLPGFKYPIADLFKEWDCA